MAQDNRQREYVEIFHSKTQHLSSAISLHYAGYEQCRPSQSFGPARRGQYLLHFIINGSGRFVVNNRSFELSRNHVFLIKPGETTYYIADNEHPWEYMWFAFDGNEVNDILRNCNLLDDLPYLNYVHESSLLIYLQEILNELKRPRPNDYNLLGYMYLIFSFLSKNCQKKLIVSRNNLLNPCLKYIHDNYSSDITVQEIANHVKMDRTYLYRLFIKEFSLSPKQYLTYYRLRAAADLLRTTSLSITEISRTCGFSDTSAFGKYFLKQTGFTPTEYRNIDGNKQLSWKSPHNIKSKQQN